VPKQLGTVNVEEGFFPRFASPFREHYGSESIFVRATADMFTLALSRLLSAHDRLPDGTVVPVLGPSEAERAIARLIKVVPTIRELLLQEALGDVPLGSFGDSVDARLGTGAFARWLAHLEAGEFVEANALVPQPPQIP
jgi:hypothetical protein